MTLALPLENQFGSDTFHLGQDILRSPSPFSSSRFLRRPCTMSVRGKVIVRKSRKGNVQVFAREQYLRDDLSCGARPCPPVAEKRRRLRSLRFTISFLAKSLSSSQEVPTRQMVRSLSFFLSGAWRLGRRGLVASSPGCSASDASADCEGRSASDR